MRVALVIPAYNAGPALGDVVRQAVEVVGAENVVVVDDGSTDGSCSPDALSAVRCICHTENRGKGEALKSGFAEAIAGGFDAVVTLDADGQHDPGLVGRLVEEAENSGADLVIGSRMGHVGRMPWLRRLTNRTTSYFVSVLAGQRIEDSQCGFRLIRTRALSEMNLRTSRYDTESEMLIQAGRRGFTIQSVAIPSVYGLETSKIRPWTDTLRFIRLVIGSLSSRRDDGVGDRS